MFLLALDEGFFEEVCIWQDGIVLVYGDIDGKRRVIEGNTYYRYWRIG